MTQLLRNLSIRLKLIIVITMASGMALVAATAAFVAFDWVNTKEAMVARLEVIAGIVAEGAVSSLAFDDPPAAEEVLSVLKSESHIVVACVYDPQGEISAKVLYSRRRAPG